MPSQGYDPVKSRKKIIEANNKHDTYLASLKGLTLKEYRNEWQRKFQEAHVAKYEKCMQKAIKHEDYEQAALIRDFIKHLNKGNSLWSGHHISKHIKDFFRYS